MSFFGMRNFVAGALNVAALNVTGNLTVATGGRVVLPAGSAAAPSLTFTGSTTTGLYSSGTDVLAFARAGGTPFFLGTTGPLFASAVTFPAGTLAAPAIKFTGSSSGTGLSAETADQMVLGRAGVSHIQSSASLVTVLTNLTIPAGAVTVPAGTAAAPSIRFTGSNAGTGFSMETADQVLFSRSGTTNWSNGSGGLSMGSGISLTTNGTFIANGHVRIQPKVETGDFTFTASTTLAGSCYVMTGGTTATLNTTPLSQTTAFFYNMTGGAVTIARNGHLINGASADVSIADKACAVIQYNGASGFYISEAAPA